MRRAIAASSSVHIAYLRHRRSSTTKKSSAGCWGGAQFGVVENSSSNARPVAGGGRVVGAYDNFDLRQHVGGGSGIGDHEVYGADTLAVPGQQKTLVNTTAPHFLAPRTCPCSSQSSE